MHDRTVLKVEDRHVIVWDPKRVTDLIMEAMCIAVEWGGGYRALIQSLGNRARFLENVALNMSYHDPCGTTKRPIVSIGTASFLFDSGIKSGEDTKNFPTLYIKGVLLTAISSFRLFEGVSLQFARDGILALTFYGNEYRYDVGHGYVRTAIMRPISKELDQLAA